MTMSQLFANLTRMAQQIESLPNPPGTAAANAHQWLHAPYYLAAQVWVATTSSSGVPAETLTVDSYLQSVLASTMSYIQGYLNPAFQTGLTARTAQAIIDMYVATAQGRATAYPSTGIGIDLVAMGTRYGNLQVSLMQQIDSGQFTGGTSGVSVFDAWVALG